ncbi:short-chain dehydrogenase/reductase SDR [Paenibacillus alvei TS-15]|uniref:Short-chain dehydrogenase/reductase SDR n=1 Tax=Paenibacillus alvei TS-15 TaxID=1117108 RepID=S9SUR2_PAEAL|nr:SDR family NAD(P)-dependent oxidoreductase [Paenibacillus alvei]EPY07898.1 short-chain dehydrogenase/reductase SDR [Paenibacillus alvei TS-15]
MKLLDNKVIMVTGASRGIGREMAVTFAQQGATLVLVSRNEEALVHLEKELDQYSNNVIKMSYDIRDLEKTKDAFKFIKKI